MKVNRREFIGHGTGLLAVGAGAFAPAQAAAAAEKWNRFAYDLDRFSKTDPKLIGYEQDTRFPSGLTEPRRLAIGPGDTILAAGGNRVSVFDAAGTKQRDISPSGAVRCLAVAPDGTVYAGLKTAVEVHSPDGARTAVWDVPGVKTWLTGLTLGGNNLYAADSGNRSILRFDLSGKLAGRIGERNKEKEIPGLVVPSPYVDVDFGKDGLLRVNNPGRHRVELYTPEGDLELFWGRPSAAIDGFCGCCNPIGLCLLPDGRTVTCEKGLPRVKVYGADGKLECVVAGVESFPENAKTGAAYDPTKNVLAGMDAAVDSRGRIWILDLVTGDIRGLKHKPA